MINFPFGTNGKFIILGVPILKHITVGQKMQLLQSYGCIYILSMMIVAAVVCKVQT